MIKYIKWSLAFLIGSLVLFYMGFVIQPYYYAWKYDAELVSETFIPTPISRTPCLNGRALVYMQDAGDEGLYLRVVDGDNHVGFELASHQGFAFGGISWCSINIFRKGKPYMIAWEEGKGRREYAVLGRNLLEDDGFWDVMALPKQMEYVFDFTSAYATGKVKRQDGLGTQAQIVLLAGNDEPEFDSEIVNISKKDVEILFYSEGWIVFLEGEKVLARHMDTREVREIGEVFIPAVFGESMFVFENTLYFKEKKKNEVLVSSFDFRNMKKMTEFAAEKIDSISVDEERILFFGKVPKDIEKGLYVFDIKSKTINRLVGFPKSMTLPTIYNDMVYWEEKLFYPYSFIESIMPFFGINLLWSDPDVLPSHQSYLFRKSLSRPSVQR